MRFTWNQVREVVDAALELAPGQRARYLEEACPDLSLRRYADSIILSYDRAGSFLEEPAVSADIWASVDFEESWVGKRIGPYELIEEIGVGGMGAVYKAIRADDQYKKQVAIKVIKSGFETAFTLNRFRSERQILANLEHPNIARLLDGGSTEQGHPYFVMEFVEGLPIDQYCQQHGLALDERLQLFRSVCLAVEYAHQNLVIHRDLKPGNILITKDGVPKLLDFGLAKLLTQESLSREAEPSVAYLRIFTPEYASPEQITGARIGTSTDIYSLGVVFYLLLTGKRPYEVDIDRPAEMLRAICELEPVKPSVMAGRPRVERNGNIKGNVASASAIAGRKYRPEKVRHKLAGDLDNIAMMALRKEPQGRYSSVQQFSDDIRRHLEGEPVYAHPATIRYRTSKFVKRHRFGVGVSVAAVLLLIGFAATMALQAGRIAKERDRANREAEASKRVAQFMTDMFKVSDPNENRGNSVTAREILDKASDEIGSGLAKDPQLQTRMMRVMGSAYLNLGVYPRAQALFESGIKASGLIGSQDNRDSLQAKHDLAWALFQQGQVAEAENMERTLLSTQQRVLGNDDPDTLATMGELAFTLCEEKKCNEGVQLNRVVLEKQQRILGPEAFATLITMDNLAIMLSEAARPVEARELEQKSLEIHRRVFGRESLGTINALINLADFERDLGHDNAAERLFRQAFDIERRVLGPNQPETAATKYDLACVLARRGQRDEALSFLGDAIDHGLPQRISLRLDKDPYFYSLHGDRRFRSLLTHLRPIRVNE